MPVKVMIVDDSNFTRKVLAKLISSDTGFKVVGLISNGEEAVRSIPLLKPDVVTLDVDMAGMDGIATLKKIMATNPTPVIMLSSYTRRGAAVTMEALQEGAVDFVQKPTGPLSVDLEIVRCELIKKIAAAAAIKPKKQPVSAVEVKPVGELRLQNPEKSVVAICASTGGVKALKTVITQLPKYLPLPVLIVQHMPPHFTSSLAEILDSESFIKVKEGEEGDILEPGTAYLAPGGLHMTVRAVKKGVIINIHLDKEPLNTILRPCADVTFGSVAEVYGGDSLGVILTGMGNDGTRGLQLMKMKGARVIAQDEATSVVYGMPRTAVEAGVVDISLPLNEIASQIKRMVM